MGARRCRGPGTSPRRSEVLLLCLTLACGTAPARHSLTGTVIEVRPDALLVAHDDIPGVMDAMTMPFTLADPADGQRVRQGDRISSTLVAGERWVLTNVVVTERSVARAVAEPRPRAERRIEVGQTFGTTKLPLAGGGELVLGPNQKGPVVLTFLYTRCPLPEFCPLVTRRLLELQPALPDRARAVAVTLDPEYDTLEVLEDYGTHQGAVPGRVDFGRLPREMLLPLVERAGLTVHGKGLDISHDLVLVVLGADGRVLARYRDMHWDRAEVLAHLGP